MPVIFTSAYVPLAHGALNWDTQLGADIGALGAIVNGTKDLGSGQDLNGYNFQGTYHGFSFTNAPTGAADTFLIQVIARPDGGVAIQTAYRIGVGNYYAYRRFYIAGTGWTTWVQV